MESENKDILERNVSEKMCSSGSNGAGEICSPGTADTHRKCCEISAEIGSSRFSRNGVLYV